MEPLRDDELDLLLRQGEPDWKPSPWLDVRVWERHRRRPWEWLWRGSIRIPVPVALALVLGVMWWQRGPEEIDFDQFRPVEQLEIKLVRTGDAER